MPRKGEIVKSLYDWCIENNRQDILDRFDYELNNFKPSEISISAKTLCYLKCSRGLHQSEATPVCVLTHRKDSLHLCKRCGSFEQWCLDNNRNDLLIRWDYDLNNKAPYDIASGANEKYYFKCPKNIHNSESFKICNITCKHYSANCHVCDSFGQWCIDNKRIDLLLRWDYSRNKKDPFDVYKKSPYSFYFFCNDFPEHASTKYVMYFIHKESQIICDMCNSFAKWGIDNINPDFINMYWDFEKNIGIDPWLISKCSNIYVYIKQPQYPDLKSRYLKCGCFVREITGIGHKKYQKVKNKKYYCNQPIDPKNSFAQYHIDNTDKDFLSKYWGDNNIKSPYEYLPYSNSKVWIKCQDEEFGGEFQIECNQFTIRIKGGYHKNIKLYPSKSIGAKYPKSFLFWSPKNSKTPYDHFACGTQKVYWMCENGIHDDYLRSPENAVLCDFRCPHCVELESCSFLQKKVNTYLTDNYTYDITHERKCSLVPINPRTGRSLPFDAIVESISLVIEVNGIQHYQVCGFHKLQAKEDGITPEQELHYQQVKDRYKRLFALSKGYFYLEISYKDEKDDYFKIKIDQKISEILTNSANN